MYVVTILSFIATYFFTKKFGIESLEIWGIPALFLFLSLVVNLMISLHNYELNQCLKYNNSYIECKTLID